MPCPPYKFGLELNRTRFAMMSFPGPIAHSASSDQRKSVFLTIVEETCPITVHLEVDLATSDPPVRPGLVLGLHEHNDIFRRGVEKI